VAGSCKHGNEPFGSINDWEFLDWLSDYQLLKKDSAPWSWLVRLIATELYNKFPTRIQHSQWNSSALCAGVSTCRRCIAY
jgi:hypothetical protein